MVLAEQQHSPQQLLLVMDIKVATNLTEPTTMALAAVALAIKATQHILLQDLMAAYRHIIQQ
jgi:hypothetical protein